MGHLGIVWRLDLTQVLSALVSFLECFLVLCTMDGIDREKMMKRTYEGVNSKIITSHIYTGYCVGALVSFGATFSAE